MKENKINNFLRLLKKNGITFANPFNNKTIELTKKEDEARKIVEELNKKFSSLIEKLMTEELSEQEINSIVNECEELKQNVLDSLDEILKSDDITDKDELNNLREEVLKSESIIQDAKEKAMKKIESSKEEQTEEPKVFDSQQSTDNSKTRISTIKPQVMTAIDDDASTSIPTIEPILEEISKNDEEPVEVQEEPEVSKEEPIESEKDSSSTTKNDITGVYEMVEQSSDWYEFVGLYFEQSGIAPEEVHKFYKDIDQGNYPPGFYTKEEFAQLKQKLEDEKALGTADEKIEKYKKKIREQDKKITLLSEDNEELKAKDETTRAKLNETRDENLSLKNEIAELKHQMKEKEQEIENLKKELSTAQEAQRQAQAQAYKERTAKEERDRIIAAKDKENLELQKELESVKRRNEVLENEKEEGQRALNKQLSDMIEQFKGLKGINDKEPTVKEEIKDDTPEEPTTEMSKPVELEEQKDTYEDSKTFESIPPVKEEIKNDTPEEPMPEKSKTVEFGGLEFTSEEPVIFESEPAYKETEIPEKTGTAEQAPVSEIEQQPYDSEVQPTFIYDSGEFIPNNGDMGKSRKI